MKLLLYHGRNDTAISPGNTVNYYSSVLSKMGPKQDSWVPSLLVGAGFDVGTASYGLTRALSAPARCKTAWLPTARPDMRHQPRRLQRHRRGEVAWS
ncbi:MAG: hypothetical protein DMF96_00330 [Acidobacteria bacterium]|nr:MAG: hypothetical protein DMF96_00330 [Acidobacteriota bacterium]